MHQFGKNAELEIELNLKINRELDDIDNHNISRYIQDLVNEIHVNTVALDPNSKIEAEKNKTEILSLFNQPIYIFRKLKINIGETLIGLDIYHGLKLQHLKV